MKPEEKIAQHSNLAFSMMAKHNVPPMPENYTVWYAYVLSENKNLVKEIDQMINAGVPFTPQRNMHLFSLATQGRNQEVMEDTARDTQRVLGEVLRMIGEFSGQTTSYSQDIDREAQKMSEQVSDPALKSIVRHILGATSELNKRSAALQSNLEASKKEVDLLRQNLQEVTIESQRDFLTHIYNRKAFDRMLGEQMVVARHHNTALSMLLIDIDHFKQFNDKFGHLLGDEVLKIVAKALTDSVRGRDVVARYGGEEFVVVLPVTPLKGAMIVADTIRRTIATKEVKHRDTGEHYGVITVSIGVAQLRPHSDTAAGFLKRADDAMYYSKRNGRNRVSEEAGG